MPLSSFCASLSFSEVSFPEAKASLVGRAAKRDNLSVKDTKDTIWYLMLLDGEEVGITALLKVKGTLYRLKAGYVLPEWRRQGFYSIAAVHRMCEAKRLGAEEVMAFVRPSSKAALMEMGWTERESKYPAVEFNLNNLTGEDLDMNLHELTEKLRGA
ncbi:MAG: hypothetical protein ACWGQW_09745 [bacterium]